MPTPGRAPGELELLARRDPHLLANDVDPRDELRDRVLDLKPTVHLDEVEAAVGSDEELERSGVSVADRDTRALDRALHLLARLRIERRRRRLLDQLLVPSLDRALALTEREHVALAVAQDLDLDVAGRCERLLHVQRTIAKGGFGLGARRGVGALELVLGDDESHPLATAAR